MRKALTVAITILLIQTTFIGFLTFNSHHTAVATTVPGGDIMINMTWDIGGSPWIIEGDVYVKNESTLTIDPGVVVKFNGTGGDKYGLYISNGTLLAHGDSSARIWFTAYNSTEAENWTGIQVDALGRVEMDHCNITYAKYALTVYDAPNNTISNTNISDGYDGIRLYNSQNNTISNTSVSDNWNNGIFLSESWNTTVQNCNIFGNFWHGVHLYRSYGNNITGNNISNNNLRGIFGAGSSGMETENNEIMFNTISTNGEGIRLQAFARNNNITRNNISWNTNYGVHCSGIQNINNRFYHNIFWNNTMQANDTGGNNFWDDGYPSGGNYWTDFDEAAELAFDSFTGPGQNEPGGDGIVDTWYLNITGGAGAVDHYPLMTQSFGRIYVYLSSPMNNSISTPGTVLDFIVVGDDVVLVNYSRNGEPNVTLPEPWDINTSGWPDDYYNIEIFVNDTEGNLTTFWFNITIDSTLPEIILNSPPDNSNITQGTTIDLDVVDDHLLIVNYNFTGGSNTTLPAPFDINTTLWSDGDYIIQVWAVDDAGNYNTTKYNFTLDGSKPVIVFFDPGDDSYINSGPDLQFSITDPHLDNSTIVYWKDGTGPWVFAEPYNITTGGWGDGVYTITVNASDTLGNNISEIFIITIDNILPKIILNSPADNSTIPAGDALDFTILDANLLEVSYFKDLVGPNLMSWPYDIDTTGWVDGTYRIDIFAEDKAGNINTSYYNFTIATLPEIILNFPANNSLIEAGTILIFLIFDANLDPNGVKYSLNGGPDIPLLDPYDISTFGWADANYIVEVHAIDDAGNTNTAWFNFTVDSSPPIILLVSPGNNTVITPGTMLDFTVTDDHLTTVNVSIDGVLTDPFISPYNINTTNASLWTENLHTVKITAEDDLGHITTRTYYFTIDFTPPVINLTSPGNNSLIAAGTPLDFDIIDDNLNYTTVSINGSVPLSLLSPWDIDTSGWDGNFTIEVVAVDLAGYSTTSWFNFTIDGILPVILMISPGNNSYVPSGTWLDFNIYDIHLASVTYSINAGPITPLTAPYDKATTGWPGIVYNIAIEALDTVGNKNTRLFIITIDSTPPVIQLIFPDDNSSVEVGMLINLSVTDSNLDFVNYTVNSGSNTTLAFPFEVNTLGFPDGDVVLTVYATDLAGNLQTAVFHFIFNDTTKPYITLNSPVNRSHVPAGTIIDITVFDLHLSDTRYTLDSAASVTLSSPYNISTSTWSEGTHTLSIYAVDTIGNENTSAFVFTIDSIKPQILLISHHNNSVILPGGILNFSVTDDNLANVNYSINSGATSDFPFPFDITAVWAEGPYTILIQARDVAGNANTSLFTIIIDSLPPVITLLSPHNNSFVPSGTAIEFDISDVNLDHAEYSVNGGPYSSLPASHAINTTGWVDGVYTIDVRADDPPGNTESASYRFWVDSTPPAIVRITAAEPYFPFNDTIIVILFSEVMNRTSVEEALSVTPHLDYTIFWGEDGQTLFLKDLSGIQLSEYYTVDIGETAVDLAGNHLVDYEGLTFKGTEGPEEPDDRSILEFWWVIPILIALLVVSLLLVFLIRKEQAEEPPGEVDMVEDMFLKMRAQEDIDGMKSLLSQGDLGDRVLEAELLFKKAKEAFDNGEYNSVTVYEKTLRDMLAAGEGMEMEPESPEPPEPDPPPPEETEGE
jgi:parallel beta-helix repeat protein